ncbi:PQQ-dependent sugar dehydrogenase [Streptomyces sp. MAR4 CNX-425]|uniref:PQQ-dependent sugar dehydrogenase n=1 Tax=Streptomyces sp. MAR4 CNX-425 TaxID=3406343 RepID=UPI003B509AB8
MLHLLRRRWTAPLFLVAVLALFVPLTVPLTASATEPTVTGSGGAAAEVPLEELAVTTTQVAFGLRRPIDIAAPDDGSGRLFIAEKRGTVRAYHPDTGLAEEFVADLTDVVDESGNERGLLSILPDPAFPEVRDLYVVYTALPDGAVTLARYGLDDGGLEVLLSQEHAEQWNHNGGTIAFGPDGYLYWTIGDGGGAGDPYDSGQRLDTLLGKMLRIDVSRTCGDLPYCVPDDNPFVGVPDARPEIWAYGLRNPWRFSFDSADGSLWLGDVGQGTWEEINHVARTEQAGANFGWSCREGLVVFDEAQCADGAEYTDPVFTYSPYTGGCAVVGGRVYRGEQYADLLGGTYIGTDYCSSAVWALREDGEGGYEQAEIGRFPTQITDVGETVDGEFYLVNDLPGGLHKVAFEQQQPTCRIDLTSTTWGGGLTADLTVTNTGSTPVDGWTLTFPLALDQTVISDWNTDLVQLSNMVRASNGTHNAVIEPGESISLGYLASHTGDVSPPKRANLNGEACALTTSEVPVG